MFHDCICFSIIAENYSLFNISVDKSVLNDDDDDDYYYHHYYYFIIAIIIIILLLAILHSFITT